MRVLLFFFAAPAIFFGQQRPVPPSDCAADGFVANSLTGEPIPRALVQVLGQSQARAVADSAGRWKMSGIVCGRLAVVASKGGFLPPLQGRMFPGNVSGPVVTSDAPLHDLKVELIPQSVLTGRVVDEAGDPVQNAQIMVMTSRVMEGRRTFEQSSGANTNDLGEYRVPGLAAGKLIVCARAPNPPPVTDGSVFRDSCYPGPVEGGAAGALSLAAGRESRVDFTLSRQPSVRIRGKVTGVPENAAMMLTLMPRAAARGRGPATQVNLLPDSAFEMRGVPPGAWTLTVDYWESNRRLLARVPVDVGGSDLDGVIVHLEPAFSVTGTVRVESASGRNPNLPQISLNLRAADVTQGAGAVQWDKNHTGFTINDATPGVYMLNVNVPSPFYLKSALLGGRDLSHDAVPLTQAAGPIDVVIADDAGFVHGRLEDSNGEAVSGWVMLFRDGHPPLSQPAGADGTFKIGGLAPGDYRVFGWNDSNQVEWADPDWMRRNAGTGVAVSVAAGQTAETKITRATVPLE